MSIAHPIGYPTANPIHNPKGYPNRGRIARPVSARIDPSYTRETSHHGVAYVTRMAAAPAPVEPRDDMMTGLSIIEGIDLDAEVPCEAEWFCPNPESHAADYLVRENCDLCRLVEVLAYCSAAWAAVFTYETLECDRCEDTAPPAEVMRIVEVLR